MSVIVIWVDRHTAKLFHFSQDKMERRNIQARHQDHHTHAFDNLDVGQQEKRFFAEVTHHLTPADQILLLGPGVAKHHFQNYVIEHCPSVGRKIVGCETVDHPTDPQIAALARKFFKLEVLPA